MAYISSYLKKNGHQTTIVDGVNLDLDNDQIVKRCQELGARLVGLYVLSAYFLDAVDLIGKLHAKGFKVVLGGAHPSFMPKFTLEKSGADFIVAEEAEKTTLELVNALEKGLPLEGIPGLYTKENPDKYISRPITFDLDEFPFPDWEQIDPRKYKKAPHGGFIRNFPYAPISASRGCPYKCTFCASPKFSRGTIRFRSPENVVDEIEYLVKNFGIKEIHFEDDNLTLWRDFAVKICNLIIERKIKVSWACPNGIRADKVDLELLKLMKKSGCYYVAFGIESGNQEILDGVKKELKLDDVRNAVKLTNKVGIMSQGFFIFGLPGETAETIEETIKFAKSLPLTRAQFLILDVMPGTEIWDNLNFSERVDWTKNSYHEITWRPPTVDSEVLANSAPRAFKEFYMRPRQMMSMISYIRPQQIPFLLKRLKDIGVFKTNHSMSSMGSSEKGKMGRMVEQTASK